MNFTAYDAQGRFRWSATGLTREQVMARSDGLTVVEGEHNPETALINNVVVAAIREQNGTVFNYNIGGYEVDPVASVELARKKRNQLLAESDHEVAADRGHNAQKLRAWQEYRKALRDLPGAGFAVWPTQPDK